MKEGRVLYPYSIVLGQTVYLKQHEENFTKYLPDRLQNDGLKFQTFYAFTKDQVVAHLDRTAIPKGGE